jgi:ComF family protein
MKTDRNGRLAVAAARLFFRNRRHLLAEQPFDCVAPVPMFYWRRWHRGVNGPECFGEELARLLKVRFSKHLIRRVRATHPQSEIETELRRKNVLGAFAVSRFAPLPKDRHILLVDDILTTGATASEVSHTLLAAGAASVTLAVIARAG